MARGRGARRLGRWLVMAGAGLVLMGAAPPAGEQEQVRWLGQMRHVAYFAPAATGESPLLLVLGEPGRSARYALDSWREVAAREGVIVAAVASQDPWQWRAPQDGPGLLRAVVRRLASLRDVDSRRVYLFGAGTGGIFALVMGTLEPDYFAAVASFDGEVPESILRHTDRLARPLPVHIFHSKRLPQFSVEALQQAAVALREAGAEVELERLPVGSDFERAGHKVAARIWAVLAAHRLADEPRYVATPYDR